MEEVLQKIQQIGSYNHGTSNKFFQQRGNFPQQAEKQQFTQVANANIQGAAGKPPTMEAINVMQQQQQVQQPQQQGGQSQIQNVPKAAVPNQANRNAATPLPPGISRCVQSSAVYN